MIFWPSRSAPSRSDCGREPDPIESAKDVMLNKAGKVGLAHQAIVLGNLAEIARDDVDAVRRLRAKHLGSAFASPPQDGSDDMGDIIVCDDYHRDDPGSRQPSRAWPLAVGLFLGGGLVAAALTAPMILERLVSSPRPSPREAEPVGETRIITTRSGFILDLPGGKSPARDDR